MRRASKMKSFLITNIDRVAVGVASSLLTIAAVMIALYSAHLGSFSGVVLSCLIASAPAMMAFVSVRSLLHDYQHSNQRKSTR